MWIENLRTSSAVRKPAVLAVLLAFLSGAAVGQQSAGKLLFRTGPAMHRLSAKQVAGLESIEQRATTAAVDVVSIARLGAVFRGGDLEIPLSRAERVKVLGERVERRGPTEVSYFGNVAETGGRVNLVVEGDQITGRLRVGAELYSIVPLGAGVHAVVRLWEPAFGPCGVESRKHAPPAGDFEAALAGGDFETQPLSVISEPPTIKVLVAYTADAANAVGSISGSIQQAEDLANDAYARSGVGPRIEVVHSVQVTYTESGNSNTDVTRLQGTTDGHMDNVHGLRDQYGADVVKLLVAQLETVGTGQICGRASTIGANSGNAFGVTRTGCITNHTFAHELGHLWGARHNDDGNNTPAAYGHGYLYLPGPWRTIMGRNPAGQFVPRIEYFSNPDVTVGGVPVGTAQTNDVARLHDNRGDLMASFRQILIAGPNPLLIGETGTWLPYNDGALLGPKTYKWYTSTNGSSWTFTGVTSRTYTKTGYSDFYLRLELGYAGGTEVSELPIYVLAPGDPE